MCTFSRNFSDSQTPPGDNWALLPVERKCCHIVISSCLDLFHSSGLTLEKVSGSGKKPQGRPGNSFTILPLINLMSFFCFPVLYVFLWEWLVLQNLPLEFNQTAQYFKSMYPWKNATFEGMLIHQISTLNNCKLGSFAYLSGKMLCFL